MLRIRLLGGLELEVDGRPLQPPASRPARALLGWLALHPGVHPRGRVAARLWPDVLDSSARASLRTTLHALRRALGDADGRWLAATRDGVGLRGELWIDALAFGELAAGRPEEALELARGGELLAGLDDDWVLVARDEHREAVLDVLERLAQDAERAGDHAAAVRWTREQAARDPLSERRQRALMTRLAAAGDGSAALAVYDRLRERLRSELRTAPSPPTRELAERLRGAPPAAEPAAPAAAPASDPAALAPPPAPPPLPAAFARRRRSAFVGREPELARLHAALAVTRAGERRLVALAGEPGIGKTRLLGEFAAGAHAGGATVLLGRCAEEPLAPYQPFAEALRPLAAELPAELTAGAPDASEDRGGGRWRLFEAIDALLRSSGGPLLLALDDVHWADRPTLALLAHLVASPEPAALLVVATHRTAEVQRAHPLAATLAGLHRQELAERIDVRGLGDAQIRALRAAWLGAGSAAELDEMLRAQTAGNPFFVEELLSQYVESGSLGPVPAGVKDVVGRRLERLGRGANRVLTAAAVAGHQFDVTLLECLPDLAGEDALAAVEAASAAQLVREEPGSPGLYAFAHALVRQTLYDELSAVRRARLHAALAAAIEQRHRDAPERHLGELAHHHLAAVTTAGSERAANAALAAARAAAMQLAYEEAGAWYERALGALPAAAPARTRGETLLALGDARERAGERAAARDAFRAAAQIARELADGELLARAALGFSGIGVTIIAVDSESVALLREALAAAGEQGAAAARLVARLAVETYYGSTPQERKALGDRAVELARASGDELALIDALNARHVALWSAEYLDERLRTAQEIVALAERAGDAERAIQGHNWLVLDHAERGDMDAARREIARHEELAGALRLPSYQWWGPMWRSTIAIMEGRLDDARALVAEFAAIGARVQDANAALYSDVQRHAFWLEEETFGAVPDDLLERQYGAPAEAAYRAGFAWVYAARGERERAREMLEWVAGDGFARLPHDMNRLAALCELAQASALLGDARHAAALYAELAPYGDRNVLNARGAAGYGSVSLHLADVAALLGDRALAARHYEDAIAHNERIGAVRWLERARRRHAELRR